MNSNQQVRRIPAAQIIPGNNDRTEFDPVALQELATSIQNHGLAQPITIRPIAPKQYQIVAGERRFRAMTQVLGWDTVPALVRELTDEEASAIMLVENTSRVDLDPIAEADAYSSRINQFGWSIQDIAETAGVSQQRVKDRLALLGLAEDIRHYVKKGQFPLGHALLVTRLDINRQRIALRIFGAAKYMPLARFQEVVGELMSDQVSESQLDMFANMWVEHVQQDTLTLRGKKAKTGAPMREDLPAVKVTGKDTVGDILDRYITQLLQAGMEAEAATLGNVYNVLVAGNWVGVPPTSLLAKVSDVETEAGDAPTEKI
jgi:ParB/RepB/Spo0J family partition protein